MQWPYINHIANTGNVPFAEITRPATVAISIVIGKVLNIKRLLQGMQICTAFYQPAVTVGNDFRRFVSVREFTRMASSTSSGVTRPCTTPNSLVTITKLPRARRSTPSRLIGSRFPGR